MAGRFGYHSFNWDDNYNIRAEGVQNPRDKTVKKLSVCGKGFSSKRKKKKRNQQHYRDEFPEDIPFYLSKVFLKKKRPGKVAN